jgi:hypothetical protein
MMHYAGPSSASYYPSSAWIDHFLIHDDNFGPYLTLSSRSLEAQPVQAHWIIGLHPAPITVSHNFVEVTSASRIGSLLPMLAPLATGRWFEYITRHPWRLVLRTLLVDRDVYVNHLGQAVAHDGSRMAPDEITRLTASLPDRFWMTEFTLPALYSGNRSKLGELLLDANGVADKARTAELVLGFRLPNLVVCRHGTDLEAFPSAATAHMPILRLRAHDHEW